MTNPIVLPRLLKEREAAQYLGISPRTLWSWRQLGRISFVRFGNAVRYCRDDLDDFIRVNRVQV